eukprot:10745435-Ditylum_brightwellii.AAC.1
MDDANGCFDSILVICKTNDHVHGIKSWEKLLWDYEASEYEISAFKNVYEAAQNAGRSWVASRQ